MGAFRDVPCQFCRCFLKSATMDIALKLSTILSACVLGAISLALTHCSAHLLRVGDETACQSPRTGGLPIKYIWIHQLSRILNPSVIWFFNSCNVHLSSMSSSNLSQNIKSSSVQKSTYPSSLCILMCSIVARISGAIPDSQMRSVVVSPSDNVNIIL